jgi:hypothetical protein
MRSLAATPVDWHASHARPRTAAACHPATGDGSRGGGVLPVIVRQVTHLPNQPFNGSIDRHEGHRRQAQPEQFSNFQRPT